MHLLQRGLRTVMAALIVGTAGAAVAPAGPTPPPAAVPSHPAPAPVTASTPPLNPPDAVPPTASITPFSGPVLTASTVTFSGALVVAGSHQIPLVDCDAIQLAPALPASTAAAVHAVLGIWLTDGSWLPADSVVAGGAPDTIEIQGQLGVLDLPLAKVLGWGPHLLPAGPDGLDVVEVTSGSVQGHIQGISDGVLSLNTAISPDKPLPVPMKDIHGVRIAAPHQNHTGLVLSVSLDPDQPPLYLLPQDGLPLAGAPTVKTGSMLSALPLRVEGGRRSYLSLMTPNQVAEEGAFDVVWHWKADTDLDGGPLRVGGVRYARGVSLHSKCSLAWGLGGSYLRLHGIIGISDAVAPEGDCVVDILADGHSLWSRVSVKGTDKPQPVDLDLHGAKTLEVTVDFGARYDIGDHLCIADAWLLKKAR